METPFEFNLERLYLNLIIGVIIGLICCYVAPKRGRSALNWFFLGWLFGIFGFLALFILPNKKDEKKKDTLSSARKPLDIIAE